jgi:hypothetical protein
LSKEIYRHIKETLLYTSDSEKLSHTITPDMFDSNDLDEIIFSNYEQFIVSVKGINGYIPNSFFDEDSQRKISKIYRKRNSPLRKVLDGHSS